MQNQTPLSSPIDTGMTTGSTTHSPQPPSSTVSICVQAVQGSRKLRAGFAIMFSQTGNDVVATGIGSVNLAGLTPGGLGGGQVDALFGTVIVGTASAFDTYIGITGPASFGPGSSTPPTKQPAMDSDSSRPGPSRYSSHKATYPEPL
jgi:hypothetical protein